MNARTDPWSRPALLGQVLRRRADGRAEVLLRVPALQSPVRVLTLERALHALPAVARMAFETPARRIRIAFDDAMLPLPRLREACAAAGCPAEPLPSALLDDPARNSRDASLRRLLVAGLFSMQAMMFAFVLYLGVVDPVDATTTALFRWLGVLSAIPVVGYAALPLYRDALAGLRAGHPGIDFPVAIAIGLIFLASVGNAVRGSGEVYFDSISMFVFVLLLGRHLELVARWRHRTLGDAAAGAMPLTAERRRDDGTLESVGAIELAPGDCIHVAEGRPVPCDGVLESARARLDESLLSGESRPALRRRGDAIAAGCTVLDSPLDLRVTRATAASAVATLGRLADAAAVARTSGDDPASRRFAWRVLVLAAATAAFWSWRDPARAFDATLAVLVVACPCAFAIAAPAVLARVMAVLARRGVLVARPAALAALARADRIVFDKTGTLTEPALHVTDIETFGTMEGDRALRLAAALARESDHPVARAVAVAAQGAELPAAAEVDVQTGGGIRGRVEGRMLRLGRAGFAGCQDDDGSLWLADDNGPLARLPLTEALQSGVAAAVASLRAQGLSLSIASGDATARVRATAERLGIGEWHARLSPRQKIDCVRAERASGFTVLAVGDGSNDAAALAGADVSAARVDGAALARAHADLLLCEGLGGLPIARAAAIRADAILRQNRAWAFAWNLGAIPFAALGLVPPWLAAVGMAASSLAVVLNTLRIRTPRAAPRGGGSTPLRERPA